ncbi:hypothetical protein ACJJTC_017359 [Scirpophaga incertulas]
MCNDSLRSRQFPPIARTVLTHASQKTLMTPPRAASPGYPDSLRRSMILILRQRPFTPLHFVIVAQSPLSAYWSSRHRGFRLHQLAKLIKTMRGECVPSVLEDR